MEDIKVASSQIVNSLKTFFIDNPVLIREIRSRMRGTRMLIFISVYILIVCTVTFLYTLFTLNQLSLSPTNPNQLSNIGGTIYKIILSVSTFIVVVFAPMSLSGVVAGEKEKQTFDFIRVTTISSWRYILGYILANTLFITLLIFCTLPVVSLSFVFGGVSPDEVIYSYVLLVCLSFLLSSLAIMISTLRKNVRTAQTTTIAILFLIYFLSGPALGSFAHMYGRYFALPSFSNLLLGKTSFLGISTPNIVLTILLAGYLSSFFYIISSRKLYNLEVRSFSYTQFIVLLLIADFVLISLFWKQTTVANFSILLTVTSIMMLIAVFNFAPNVIEVGDESWKIKKKIKLFRKFGEDNIFISCLFILQFLLLISFLFSNPPPNLFSSGSLLKVSGVKFLTLGHIVQGFLILLVMVIFMISVAKLASQIMKSRMSAVRLSLASFLIIFVFLPFLTLIFYATIEGNNSVPASILKMTPYVALTKILGSDLYIRHMKTIDESLFFIDPLIVNVIVYVPISLIIFFVANRKRKKSESEFLKLFSDNPFEKTNPPSLTLPL